MGSAGTNGFQMRRLAAVTANDDGGDDDSEGKGGDDGGFNEEGDVNTRYETKIMAIEEEEVYEKTNPCFDRIMTWPNVWQ